MSGATAVPRPPRRRPAPVPLYAAAPREGVPPAHSRPARRVRPAPVLARANGYILASYGVFVSAGFALGTALWFVVLGYRLHQPAPAPELAAGIAAAAWTGSRLMFAAELAWARRLSQATVCTGGHSLYGGIAGGLLLVGVLFADDPSRMLVLADAAASAIALGYAFGKLGCLVNGCCTGKPTRSRVALRYTHDSSRAVLQHGLRGVPLTPLQLVESLLGFGLAIGLTLFPESQFGTGRVLGTFLLALGITRFPLLRLRHRAVDEHASRHASAALSVALAALGLPLAAGVGVAHAPGPGSAAAEPLAALGAAALAACAALLLFGLRKEPS